MSKRRRILCFVAWWPDEEQFTGVFIKEHIKAIALRHDVQVIHIRYFRSGFSLPRTEFSSTIEDGLPIHRIRIKTPIWRFGMLDRAIRSAYFKMTRKLTSKHRYDLVHVHVLDQTTRHVPAVAEALDLPMVLTEHFSFYHTGIKALPQEEQVVQRKALQNWLSNDRLKLVMPVSKDLANVMIRDYHLVKEKVQVVPNIASDEFRPAGVKPAIPPFRLFTLAIWRPPKDHHVLIEALKLLPRQTTRQWEMVWGGYGPDMDTIIARCAEEIPWISIKFTGYMDKEAIAREMRNAHLFVLPTTAENLPCVLLESLCTGTPVISMAVNGIPEIVHERNGILVPPSDPQALSKALLDAASEKVRFDHAAISNEAISKYCETAVSTAIDQAYQRIGS